MLDGSVEHRPFRLEDMDSAAPRLLVRTQEDVLDRVAKDAEGGQAPYFAVDLDMSGFLVPANARDLRPLYYRQLTAKLAL